MFEAIVLREYQVRENVRLTADERRALHDIAPSIAILPGSEDGEYNLQPGSEIGAIALGDLRIEIRPKVPIRRVLFLLAYALDRARWRDVGFEFQQADSLVAAIAPGFVHQVRRAVSGGLLHGYRTEEDALATIRGRVRFDDQIRRHLGRFPPVEVRYDEYTADILENRLLRAALDHLLRLDLRSAVVRRNLLDLEATFEAVSLTAYDSRAVPEVFYTRLNEHYRPAVELARLILRSTSFELRHDTVRASSFLVDMNSVFEDFVVIALREALGVTPGVFPQNAMGRPLYFDIAHKVRLEPDISWWEGSVCRFVGDVKYKRVSATGIVHPDLYQMLAYLTATNLPRGFLVYAAGEGEAAMHRVVHSDKAIHVVTLDLDGTPEYVLSQIATIAELIRAIYKNTFETTPIPRLLISTG